MKNIQKNIKILIIVNIVLILFSFIENGGGSVVGIPVMLVTNLVSSIYGFNAKDKKFGTAALILFFIGPIIGFSVCLSMFTLDVK